MKYGVVFDLHYVQKYALIESHMLCSECHAEAYWCVLDAREWVASLEEVLEHFERFRCGVFQAGTLQQVEEICGAGMIEVLMKHRKLSTREEELRWELHFCEQMVTCGPDERNVPFVREDFAPVLGLVNHSLFQAARDCVVSHRLPF